MCAFARKTLLPESLIDIRSTQGLLEMAGWCSRGRIQLSFQKEEAEDISSPYSTLCRLAKEGYVDVKWTIREDGGFQIEQLVLTTSGAKLLEELKEVSAAGRFSSRFKTVFWSVVTSAITAYIVSSLVTRK